MNLKLRNLQDKDAALMLEWMHDPEVVRNMNANFAEMQIEDCLDFISNSQNDENNLHLAIVNDEDEYLGTVSLKHIDRENGLAEFAIAVRKCTMGTGVSAQAMDKILQIGLGKEKLSKIFWCVNIDNGRAIRFYDKNGYKRIDYIPETIMNNYNNDLLEKLVWYVFEK